MFANHPHAGASLLLGKLGRIRGRALPTPSHHAKAAAASVAMVVVALSVSALNEGSLADEEKDPPPASDDRASKDLPLSAELLRLRPAPMNSRSPLPSPTTPSKVPADPLQLVRSRIACMCEADSSNDDASSASEPDGIHSSKVEESAPPCSSSDVDVGEYSAPSRARRILASLRIANLPTPRLLLPGDGAFMWPELRRGLRRRARDEGRLRELEKDAREAAQSGDRDRVAEVARSICDVAYGKGVTPQDRQDFLIKYGCAAWNDDVLAVLFELGRGRGILELGAGLGQWARAISDYAAARGGEGGEGRGPPRMKGSTGSNDDDDVDFVIAYDDMSSLPLSPAIYHQGTQPAHDHFYPFIREGSCGQALRSPDARGRVLLLVFPPPGPMAADAVRQYVDGNCEHGNDTVVYVGEGRNGANADDSFFDMLENSGEWALLRVMDLPPSVGGKGFEKFFVLRRVSPAAGEDEGTTDDINVNRALQWKG